MSLSDKIRIGSHWIEGDEILPLEDVKDSIKKVKEKIRERIDYLLPFAQLKEVNLQLSELNNINKIIEEEFGDKLI